MDSEEDYDYEEFQIPVDISYLPDPEDEGGAGVAAVSSAMCVARSSAFDNLIRGHSIMITRAELQMSWIWDGTRIRGLGKTYVYQWKFKDGWRLTDRDWYVYSKNLSSGFWIKQGIEGWASFAWFRGKYEHEHHMIMNVDRAGRCSASNYFFGTLPGYGNNQHNFSVFKQAYQPRS